MCILLDFPLIFVFISPIVAVLRIRMYDRSVYDHRSFPHGFAIDGPDLYIIERTYRRRYRYVRVPLADIRQILFVTQPFSNGESSRTRTWFSKGSRGIFTLPVPLAVVEYQDRAKKILYAPAPVHPLLAGGTTFIADLVERCRVKVRIDGVYVDRETQGVFMDGYRARVEHEKEYLIEQTYYR